jgi:hypothetical protein
MLPRPIERNYKPRRVWRVIRLASPGGAAHRTREKANNAGRPPPCFPRSTLKKISVHLQQCCMHAAKVPPYGNQPSRAVVSPFGRMAQRAIYLDRCASSSTRCRFWPGPPSSTGPLGQASPETLPAGPDVLAAAFPCLTVTCPTGCPQIILDRWIARRQSAENTTWPVPPIPEVSWQSLTHSPDLRSP